MNQRYSFLTWLVLGALTFFGAPQAQASHILGGDLTYRHLAGNLYRVNFRFYRDCSGTDVSNWDLQYRNTSACSASATTVRMTVAQATVIGSPYCPGSTSNTCSTSSQEPNYDLTTYTADITLAPGTWTMFVYYSDRSRPNFANLLNADNQPKVCAPSRLASTNDMYIEATLDNTGGIDNNSPQFDPQDFVVQYVGLNQLSTITYSSIEIDGDSLVYELVPPADRCGVSIPYAPYTGGGNTGGTVTLRNGCTLTLPPAFANFSTALPLPVALDTLGNCPNRTARPSFYFNAAARTLTFTPNVFVPYSATNTVACGYNKYQLVVKITEYRRVGGVRRIVGTVRREGVIIVLNGTNHTPAAPVAGGQTPLSGVGTINRPDSLEVRVVVGNYARVSLNFTDPDPGQPLKVTYSLPASISDANAGPVPPSPSTIGTFALVGNNAPTPVGAFDFQPAAGAIPAGATEFIERINFRAEDNDCPVKGVQNRVLVVRVVTRTYLAGIAANNAAGAMVGRSPAPGTPAGAVPAAGSLYQPVQTCNNNLTLTLNGSITRPTQVRALGSTTLVLQQYRYQWSARSGGNNSGLPAVTNTPTIVVHPVATTRYFLTVTAQLGFFTPVVDTTSLLVRFLPPPTVTATATPFATCAAAAVTLTGTATRADGLPDTYTYAWSGGDLPAGTTGQTVTAHPTATTRYFLTVTGSTLVGCTASTSVEVQLLPPPTVTATASVPAVCPGGTVTLTGAATRADGLPDTYTYAWSGGGLPAGTTGQTITVHPTAATRYVLTATGAALGGCTAASAVEVQMLLPPTATATATPNVVCPGGTVTLTGTATRADGLPDTYTYTWSGGGLPAGTTGQSIAAHPTAAAQYTLTVASGSALGCSATAVVAVSLPPTPSVRFTVDSASSSGSFASPRLPITYTFTNTSTIDGGRALDSLRWTYRRVRNGSGQPVQEAETTFSHQSRNVTLALSKGGEYVFRLYAGTVAGGAACAPTVSAPYAARVPAINNPNVMTPNGDGLNDKFVVNDEYLGSKLQVFNRWGRKVEEFASYQDQWDAANQGPGIYYYLLTDAVGNTSKGWVEVLK